MIVETIVSDLDDTMLDEKGEISPYTLSVVKQCISRGIRVIPCSGRTRKSMDPFMKQLGTGQPYIGGNGTEIMDENGNFLKREQIEADTLREICSLLEEYHLYTQVYDDDCFYYGEDCSQAEKYRLSSKMKGVAVGSLSGFISGPSAKVLAINAPELNAKGLVALRRRFGDSLSYSSSKVNYLEIMPANTSKGDALCWLMNYYQWAPERVLVFGDGHNDISMIHAVPHGVAMGNADESVRSSAWAVCGPNSEDGMAHFIQTYVLKDREVSM